MKSFLALMRREYLEHRVAFFYAPLILIAVVTLLIAFSFASGHYQFSSTGTFIPGMAVSYRIFDAGYLGIAVLWGAYLAIVLFFYFADAFTADRRNNAMLFWKSMPQGDFKILMSKLLAGLTVLPALVFLALLLTGVLAAAATFLAPFVVPVLTMPDAAATGQAFLNISLVVLVYLVLALLWYAPFLAWVGALSTVVGRWSIPLALLVPVVVSLFEGVVDFRTAPGGSYILSFLRARMTFPFATPEIEASVLTNIPFSPGRIAGQIIAAIDWPELAGGLVFAVAVIYLASLYRRRVIKG